MTRLSFDPNQHIRRVVLVGLGGTGGHLARLLARMLYDMEQRGLHRPSLLFVDPDRVETKNVGRQNFSVADAHSGGFKAEVLARYFNLSLGLDIEWATEPFDPDRHVEKWNTLIIDAVDNHEARWAIARADTLTVSCGNHHNAGQVCIGNTIDRERVTHALERLPEDREEIAISLLPAPSLLFPDLLEPELGTEEPAEDLSCSELIARGDQALLINDTMAVVAAHYVYCVLHRQPIRSFMTYVDCDILTMRSIPIIADNILEFIST